MCLRGVASMSLRERAWKVAFKICMEHYAAPRPAPTRHAAPRRTAPWWQVSRAARHLRADDVSGVGRKMSALLPAPLAISASHTRGMARSHSLQCPNTGIQVEPKTKGILTISIFKISINNTKTRRPQVITHVQHARISQMTGPLDNYTEYSPSRDGFCEERKLASRAAS